MKIVLITGALGQDGTILSKIFKKKNFKVYGIVKKHEKHFVPGVNYIYNNLNSKKKLINILKHVKPNIIIHLADVNKPYLSINKSHNYIKNFENTKRLIDAVVSINLNCKFVFAGSSMMYGKQKKYKVSEKDLFNATDDYSKYKIKCYNYINNLSKKFNFKASMAILFNHDSIFRKKNFLVNRIIHAFLNKDKLIIKKIFNLNISGDFSSAQDICMGIFKVSIAKKNIDKIILSSGRRFYINKLINYLLVKFKINIKNKKHLSKLNFKIIGSNNLAKKIINYKVRENLIDVVKNILKKNK